MRCPPIGHRLWSAHQQPHHATHHKWADQEGEAQPGDGKAAAAGEEHPQHEASSGGQADDVVSAAHEPVTPW